MSQAVSYPYKRFFNNYYPIIKIHFQSPSGISETEAYIDSGASVSIFNVSVAQELDIDYRTGRKHAVLVGNGASIFTYIHKIKMKIAGVWLKVTVGFSPDLGSSINLLGQKDVFNKFKITFDGKNKKIIFIPH